MWYNDINKNIYYDLKVAQTLSGSSFSIPGQIGILEMLIFQDKGKPEYLEKNLSEQGREPVNKLNPTYDIDAGTRTWATLVGVINKD